MMRKAPVCLVVLLAATAIAQDQTVFETSWPSFRGRDARGVAEGYPTPVTWDVATGENIAWKTPIPGMAHSSPVVWGGRVFVMTAVRLEGEAELKVGLYGAGQPVDDEGPHEFKVLCVDRVDGKVLWSKTAFAGVPKSKRHPKGSFSASTPTTDGEHVVAFFGSEGLFCYDVEGQLLWKKDLGHLDVGSFRSPEIQWGFASSALIHDGRVLVQCDSRTDSFVAALDVKTGDELWRTARGDYSTWSTPTVHVGAARSQVILNGYKNIGGYDLETGEQLWKVVGGGGDIPVPTPVVAGDVVFITNSHGGSSPILAISTAATGEFSIDAAQSEHMVWSLRRGNYMQTPLPYDDLLYCCADSGALQCIDARTGEVLYRERLGTGRTGFSASGIASGGKLYFTSEEGQVHVLKAGAEFEVLAVNDMGETCMATPALSRGVLYFRTRDHLLAVAQGQQSPSPNR